MMGKFFSKWKFRLVWVNDAGDISISPRFSPIGEVDSITNIVRRHLVEWQAHHPGCGTEFFHDTIVGLAIAIVDLDADSRRSLLDVVDRSLRDAVAYRVVTNATQIGTA